MTELPKNRGGKMKKILFLIVCLCASTLFSTSLEDNEGDRIFDQNIHHDLSNVALRVSNFGFIGAGGEEFPSLQWPYYAGGGISGTDYLYHGAAWIGAKKMRRNAEGIRLFWRPDPDNEWDVVPDFSAEYDSLVNELGSLELVIDTLTTVGFDGDSDLYELLPAYNPFEIEELGDQYEEYNSFDKVLMTSICLENTDDDGDSFIDEDPLGNPFDLYDQDNIYCSTFPADEDSDGLFDEDSGYPGYQTTISYFYDYSPFGTAGQRDWGGSQNQNVHYPLGIAINQETYTWSTQYYSDLIILKHKIYNSSLIDTLYDVCYGYFFDADIGPQDWDTSQTAIDDVSSYITEENYEFPYSYDADGDDGLSPGFVGMKILDSENFSFDCWTWQVGNGPDDEDPLNLFPWGSTANQKYWLMTGRNPDDTKYTSLRDFPDIQIGNPTDTRFLYSVYGDMMGSTNPTANSINIPPQESIEFYTAIFLSTSIEGLQNLSILSEEFHDADFDYSVMEDLPCIPYLNYAVRLGSNDVLVEWGNINIPDQTYVCYKLSEAPASEWEFVSVDNELTEYLIEGLELDTYSFKIAVEFDDVYLESRVLEVELGTSSEENEIETKLPLLSNFPNPFNSQTKISFIVSTKNNEPVKLEIYNIKGQKVKTIPFILRGSEGSIEWNGRDEENRELSSGIYYCNLESGGKKFVRKMLLLRTK